MDHENQPCASRADEYPMLVIPKKCTSLETHCDPTDNVFIEVKIVSPDLEGHETCIYNGFCNVKLIDSYDVDIQSMSPREVQIEDLPVIYSEDQQSEDLSNGNHTWNNSLSPYMNNNSCNPEQSRQYSVCHQTHSKHITVEHHNTYITQNVYNFNEAAVRYAPHETLATHKQSEIQPVKRNVPNSNTFLNFQDKESSVQRILKRNTDNVDDSGIGDMSANEALRQLMSSDKPASKQRRTILYSGPDDRRGRTIQQIQYNDPTIECSTAPIEVDNEVVIESFEPIPPNLKKYQCAKCEQIFDQLANFREHMNKHAITNSKAKYRERSRSTSPTMRVCADCGKKMTDQKKFQQHCLAHGDPDLECPKCRKVFASKFTLRNHLKIHYRKYRCNFCIRSYTDIAPLRAHMAKFHSQFMCEYCTYVANTNSDLIAHQKIHKAVYTCDGDDDSNGSDYYFYEDNVQSIVSPSKVQDWICENYDENQENHEITEAGYTLNDENIDDTTYVNEEQTVNAELKNQSDKEDTVCNTAQKQVEIECFFENNQSNNNEDIIVCEDQKMICKDSEQNSPFDESQFDDTGSQFDDKGSQFDKNCSQLDENGSQFNENGNQFDENRSQFDENGSKFDENGSQYDKNCSQLDENGSQFNEKGNQFDENRSQFDENGSKFDENGSQYDNESSFDMEDDADDEDFKMSNEEGSNHSQSDRNNDSIISKAISNKVFYTSHMKKSRRFSKVCDVCHKKFDRMSDLKRHLIEHVIRSTLAKMPVSHSGSLNIECEVCHNASFHKVDHYKAHLRDHAKLTLYRCTFCNKSFGDSSNFSKHKKIHGATYFQCDLCQRKFNSKKMIACHMEYHIKNAPLPCPICGKNFHFTSTLNKHIKGSHKKRASSRFKCRFCLKHFGTLKGKWDHEWNAHKIRKMIVDCLLCGAKYRKYSELKRHCSEVHKVDIPSAKNLLADKIKKKKAVSYKMP